MALRLAPEEPEAGPWRVELLSTVVNAVTRRRPDRGGSGRPAVLAIDGRSNNGKTTLAARISELVPGSVVIHTDDIARYQNRPHSDRCNRACRHPCAARRAPLARRGDDRRLLLSILAQEFAAADLDDQRALRTDRVDDLLTGTVAKEAIASRGYGQPAGWLPVTRGQDIRRSSRGSWRWRGRGR
jgi:hypothetical protein